MSQQSWQENLALVQTGVDTMVFPTGTGTVEEAEAEFTDEADALISRMDGAVNDIVITGERACPAQP